MCGGLGTVCVADKSSACMYHARSVELNIWATRRAWGWAANGGPSSVLRRVSNMVEQQLATILISYRHLRMTAMRWGCTDRKLSHYIASGLLHDLHICQRSHVTSTVAQKLAIDKSIHYSCNNLKSICTIKLKWDDLDPSAPA